MIRGVLAGFLLALGGSATALSAQSGLQFDGMATATLLGSRQDPIPNGGRLTEVRVVAPDLIGEASYHRFRALATINLESVTIPDGVLNIGAWGEGFVDRRHPHTTVHELLVSGTDLLGKWDGRGNLGLIVGKGFVPFGTDDPMNRPFVSFPVNHHWSQILERAIIAPQYQLGRITVEAALFDGDEPEHPSEWPLLRLPDGRWRFGDSRAARVTFQPVTGLELQGSLASVHSPEYRLGLARDANKASASARWFQSNPGGERYLMAEWARTTELDGYFAFRSFLAEGELKHGRFGVAYRFESTDRPEEERLADPFRSFRPHLENSILGIGRWNLHTVHLSAEVLGPRHADESIQPFVEITLGRVRKIGGGIFDPEFMYSGGAISQINLGITLSWKMNGHRMGRYGVLAPSGMGPMNMQAMH